jgi:hypothetical protein
MNPTTSQGWDLMYGHFLAFRETMEDCADRLANNSDGWFWSRYLAMAIHRYTGRLGRQYAVLYILHTCKWLFLFFWIEGGRKDLAKDGESRAYEADCCSFETNACAILLQSQEYQGLEGSNETRATWCWNSRRRSRQDQMCHFMQCEPRIQTNSGRLKWISLTNIQHCLEVPQFITQGLWIRGSRSALICNHLRGDCAGKWVARQFLAWRARLRNMCSCGIWIIWIAVAHVGLLLLECYWFETLLMVTDCFFWGSGTLSPNRRELLTQGGLDVEEKDRRLTELQHKRVAWVLFFVIIELIVSTPGKPNKQTYQT